MKISVKSVRAQPEVDVERGDGLTVVTGVSGKTNLVRPMNSGSIHCCTGSIVKAPEPCD